MSHDFEKRGDDDDDDEDAAGAVASTHIARRSEQDSSTCEMELLRVNESVSWPPERRDLCPRLHAEEYK